MLSRQHAKTAVIPVLFHRFWSPCLAQDPQIPSEAQFHSILFKILKDSKIYIVKNGRLDQTIIIPSRYNIPLMNNDLSFHNNIILGTSNDLILFERRYGNM